MAAGESLNETGGIPMPLHGKRGQLQPGDPALGAGFQRSHVAVGKRQTHYSIKKLGRFDRGELQVGGAQLGQLAARPQPGQRQRRVLAGGDHQVHRRRQMLEQKGEGVVDGFGVDEVVVIEHQDEAVRDGGDLIEQGRQNRLDGGRLRGLERGRRPRPDVGRDGLQRRDEVRQKAGRVIIRFVQRQPDRRPAATGGPLTDQRRLAEAGGSGDKGQFVARRQPLVQSLDQARAGDCFRRWWGGIEFGNKDWDGHELIIIACPE